MIHCIIFFIRLLGTQKEVVVCDFGCANANITFAMAERNLITHLQCADLPNMSADFITYRAKKHLMRYIEWHDVRDFAWSPNQFDAVICFDVLEHLPHPSSVLCEVIVFPCLNRADYCFFKHRGAEVCPAIWTKQLLIFIDMAEDNFYQKDLKKYIRWQRWIFLAFG